MPAQLPTAVVVDDDEAIANLVRLMVSNQCAARVFTSPQDAVASVLQDPPNLVITDYSMPEWSGQRVIREIRRHLDASRVPIMVLSAVGDEDQILRCFQEGANEYLMKPAQKGELRAKVSLLLNRTRPVEAPSDPTVDLTGKHFAGYDVEALVGQGGMGKVYAARAPDGQRVALKVLAPDLQHDTASLERFLREAQHLKSISHPNIARFVDMGQDHMRYYLCMELVSGTSLAQHLATQGPLTDGQTLHLAAQVTAALQALHNAGLTHRDIKPHNILRTPDGDMKLVDFGLVRGARDKAITRTNVIIGSAAYLPPEASAGGAVDIRGDIYALGVVLYEAATGRQPFTGEMDFDVIMAHRFDAPPPPWEVRQGLDPALGHLILTLLNKDPRARPQTPDALLSQVLALQTSRAAR